ncbi:(2Fe-2S)-binding protein [Fictibacillus gelatini]|uniref:(2Fe-2S)-binding protein n=1 Tax=Fictibacillus gelatini TaxID=225985 RepID=UPI0003FFBFAF|nr:(2Fe-2S)-binding protein [Fictibacillus gelatini]
MKDSAIVICRCEEVTLEELTNTAKEYKCSARELKLRTRAGMGYCGGRTCRFAIDAILMEATGNQTPDQIPLKYQPPVRPVSFQTLGGGCHE